MILSLLVLSLCLVSLKKKGCEGNPFGDSVLHQRNNKTATLQDKSGVPKRRPEERTCQKDTSGYHARDATKLL